MIEITREHLHRLAWTKRVNEITAELQIERQRLRKLAQQLGVAIPSATWFRGGKPLQPPPLPVWNGPDRVPVRDDWTYRAKTILPSDELTPDPRAGFLAEQLDRARQFHQRQFRAFWWEVGVQWPTVKALDRARWEHVHEDPDGTWTVRGPLGRNGEQIEAPVLPMASEALRPFRKEKGPLLANVTTDRKRLSWLLGGAEWRKMVLQIRGLLGVAPSRRHKPQESGLEAALRLLRGIQDQSAARAIEAVKRVMRR